MGIHIMLALPQNTLRLALKAAYSRSTLASHICDVASSDELDQQPSSHVHISCSWRPAH